MSERLRILCFGNPLHGDDGFGPAVSLALRRVALQTHVQVVDCGTRGLDALHFFENCQQVIIVDAMAGQEPGRLHLLSPAQIPVETAGSGGHGAGVGYLLAAVRETIEMPPQIDIIAVEISRIATFSPGLSLDVAAAVAEATELIRTRWASVSCGHNCELSEELEVLRQANHALESELTTSTETLELLIAEQEQQQDELERRAQELSQLHGALERAIGTMAEIFVMLGPDGRVIRVNSLLKKELGYSPEAIVGGYFEDCLPESGRRSLRSMLPAAASPPLLLNAIRAAGGRFEAELNFCRAENSVTKSETNTLPYLVHASLIHSHAGKLEGAVVVSTNIAALKNREKALRDNERKLHQTAEELRDHRDNLAAMVDEQTRDLRGAKEQAEAASRAKSDFLSNMSHEVRTPLNAILGLSDLCMLTPLNAQQGQYLNKIRLAAKHLLGIINDILDFSRVEAGKLSIEQLSFDLPMLLEEITDLLIGRIEEKGLEFCVDIAPDAAHAFIGDPLRLKQIIINLLGNAIKFSEKGTLRLDCKLLSMHAGTAELCFSLSDEGIGISSGQQETLFSAFSQADTSTTRRYGGSGLGLAISKRLVELMGGRIWLESETGRGSTFHFTAQLGSAPDIAPSAASLREQLAPHAGRTVLIVDDNPLAAENIASQCRQLGLHAETTHAGETALAMLAQPSANYLAALIDWHMPPGIDGMATVQAIQKTLGRNAPALILLTPHDTAAPCPPDHCLADAMLLKPCSLPRLYAALAVPLHLRPMSLPPPVAPAHDFASLAYLHGADILVVDDVDLNRDLMQELLGTVGLKVRLAGDGKEALAAIYRQRPDLVLMDCQMPVMDGFAATRCLRDQPAYADLPIVALTAGALAHDREQSFAAGMNAHITKPVDLDKLLQLIVELLPPDKVQTAQPPVSQAVATTPVAPVVAATPEPSAPTPAPQAPQALPELPGVNVATGLMQVRNKVDFYRRMLVKFRDSYSASFEAELNAALAAGQMEDATRLAHSLKGASRNLGIDGLGNLAATVEAELKDPAGTNPPPGLAKLLSELNSIRATLQKLG